jgi:predicted nucleic acid-binding protein
MVVVDASVVVRWFVDQDGHQVARSWFARFVDDADLLIAPDLLRFEVHGALARLAPKKDQMWSRRAFDRFERLGLRMLSTDAKLFDRALQLSNELGVAGYEAVYICACRNSQRSLAHR